MTARHAALNASYGLIGNDSFTQLLLHMDGANAGTTFTDSSSAGRTMTRAGTPVTSTAQSKFGGASMLCDGSGDYLSTPDAAALRPGTGDYTFDCWIYTTDAASNSPFSKGWVASGDVACQCSGAKKLTVFHSGSTILADPSNFPENQWVHVAVVRASGTVTLYINGVSVASGAGSQNLSGTNPFYVGGNPVSAITSIDGHMDEVRWSVGIARWTADFTPPKRQYG